MSPSRISRCALLAFALGATAFPLLGQTVLVVNYKGKATPVIAASETRPLVDDNGKHVVARADRFGLVKVKEFMPVFVAVRNVRVRTSYMELNGAGAINNEFHFHGNFSSAYPLKDVFAVFEIHSDRGDKNLFLYELGRLGPDNPRNIDLVVPTSFRVGTGHYFLHIYSQGMEVLNSQQPFNLREAALNRIVAARIRGRTDGPPEPFIGPPPEYPAKLEKTGARGRAVIHLRVLANGAVVDPEVKSATDPAFGESAVDALRQWRFFPQIKNGRPTATAVDLPLDFVPPGKS
ncbi:MAG TPA: energy transducer TonB [Opitutus sp.]|nr:energy transducer TonB [Opitutus sp.]